MRNIWKRLLAVSLLVLLLAGCTAAEPAPETEAPAEPETTTAPETTEAPTEAETTEAPTEEETEAVLEIPGAWNVQDYEQELQEVMEKNGDVVGLLSFGKDQSLYVAQNKKDNSFYYNHDYLGEEEFSGAPWIDIRCSLDPRDTNLLIYGNNMMNGEIFSDLPKYYSADFLRQYPFFSFATLDRVEIYVPYAIADVNVFSDAEDYFQVPRFNFDNSAFLDYTGYLMEHSCYPLPITAEPGDVLMTLLTDNYKSTGEDDSRLLICLRELRPGETVEDMFALFSEALAE